MFEPNAVLADPILLHRYMRCLINTLASQRLAGTPPSKYGSGKLTKEDLRNPITIMMRQAQMDTQLDIVIDDFIKHVRRSWTVPVDMQDMPIGELTQFTYLWYRAMVDHGFLLEKTDGMYLPDFSPDPKTARNERDEYFLHHIYKYANAFCGQFNGAKDWAMSEALFNDWHNHIDKEMIREAGQRYRADMENPGSGSKDLVN